MRTCAITGILIWIQLVPPQDIKNFVASNVSAPVLQYSGLITKTEKKPVSQNPRPILADIVSEKDLKEFLKDIAVKYGQDYQKMSAVIFCESGWRTDVYSVGKISYGIAQFRKITFEENCKGNYKDPYDQLSCMGLMFSKHMENRWDCWRILYGEQ